MPEGIRTTNVRYEKHYEAQEARITVDFMTDHGQYHAAHWQKELELIYLLNGNARIVLDGETVSLVQGDFIVIDSNHIFELQCKENFMQVRVHVDKEFLSMRTGRTDPRIYRCIREDLESSQLEAYLRICDLFKELVPLYVNEPEGYRLKTESVVLEILYHLVRHFSSPAPAGETAGPVQEQQRIQEILHYIDQHYAEHISLERIAGEFGLSREYFSRLFHQSLGITFSQHVNRVRISHFYHDLVTGDEAVMELLEKNGLMDYKLFSRMFREIYGHTPREIRRIIS